MDLFVDSGLDIASIVLKVMVCFSISGAFVDVVFIFIAVGTTVLAGRHVLDWYLLWFFCCWWWYLRTSSNFDGLKRLDRLALELTVSCKQVVLPNMVL